MKKKLEAELISIAHRILKLKNKSDLIQLHQETQKLYEKLSVLRFVEEHLGDVKPTIGQTEIEDKITAAFETVKEEVKVEETPEEVVESTVFEEIETEETENDEESQEFKTGITEEIEETEEPQPEEEQSEDPLEEPTETEPEEEPIAEFDQTAEIAWEQAVEEESSEEETVEEKTDDSPFKPAFELSFDAKDESVEPVKEDAKDEFKNVNSQITFEDILGSAYVDPVFVKPEEIDQEREAAKPDNVIPIGRSFDTSPVISINKSDEGRTLSLNDRLSKGITIGLNDRVAFMKHLFNNSSEDYNRVLSQLITFDTFGEAKSFIDNMVKPDYNNWDGKDEYAERFIEIVEKKFS